MLHIGLTRQEMEHLEQIIARLDAQNPSEGADRRVHPRIDFAHPMWVSLPADAGQPWVHVYSRNLSTGGVSFLSRNIFHTGQHVVISHELNELVSMLVLCRVCFCRMIDLGVQEVGMAFVAARADPHRTREIPPEWLARVLESDALCRRDFPAAVGA